VKNLKKVAAKPAVAKPIETKSKAKAAHAKPAALKVRQTSVSGAAKEAARPEAKRVPPRPAPKPAPAPVKAAAPVPETSMTVVVVQERVTVQPAVAPASARPAAQPSSQAPSQAPSPGGAARPHIGPPPRPPAPAEIFVEGDHVVYPTHGVGKVERIVIETIAGYQLELIHITFEENRMTLRVPVEKARSAGLRKLATRQLFETALATLKGRARIKRTMWSRRAQEYEAKINSGDPLAIAEVVRDLHRNAGQPDQSFSERQIYEAAMDRLAAELAALDQTDKATAAEKLTVFLRTTH
jgi:CarD family transcriptional regulator